MEPNRGSKERWNRGLSDEADEGSRGNRGEAAAPHRTRSRGFTVLELLIAVTILAVITSVGLEGYRQFREATAVEHAAKQIGADLWLTRSFAIQRRTNVSLVADEAARTYRIRDTTGVVLARRFFDRDSALPLDSLSINLAGDSVTFNARGLQVGNGAQIEVARGGRARTLTMNAMGRSRVLPR
ncbi:MAG: Tfp pilus assembly protein FimT/FimU [Gemmatimonadota bacterium]